MSDSKQQSPTHSKKNAQNIYEKKMLTKAVFFQKKRFGNF